MNLKLTRTQIEAFLSVHYSRKFNGKVWSMWDTEKRAYSIQGEGLPPRPDFAHSYPNGWSLFDWVTTAEARELMMEDLGIR